MATKYKMTGCAKFFIFLIFAVPLAYIGASYYNGNDPFEKIKNMEIFQKKPDSNDDTASYKKDKNTNRQKLDNSTLIKELELKDEEIKFLRRKIKKLEDLIESQKQEIKRLKKVDGNKNQYDVKL